MSFYVTDSSRAHTTAAKIYVIIRVSAVRKSFQQSKLWFRLYGSVSNNYAVCGHTMVTHIAFVRMALPNLISQGPISWKSPALSQLSITRFSSLPDKVSAPYAFPPTCNGEWDVYSSRAQLELHLSSHCCQWKLYQRCKGQWAKGSQCWPYFISRIHG